MFNSVLARVLSGALRLLVDQKGQEELLSKFYIFIDRLQEDTIIYKQTRQLDIILATLLKLTRSRKLQRISCEIKIK